MKLRAHEPTNRPLWKAAGAALRRPGAWHIVLLAGMASPHNPVLPSNPSTFVLPHLQRRCGCWAALASLEML